MNAEQLKEANEFMDALKTRVDMNQCSAGFAIALAFAKGLETACERYWANPMDIKLIPNWTRVAAALPQFPGQLVDAVEADNCNGGS